MDFKGLRLLLVEDDQILREVTSEALRKAGVDVIEAVTGEEALEWLSSPPDAIFTDIHLPGEIDGWAVAERFRAADPAIPVIYATAYSKAHTPVEGSVFFRKPYKVRQVLLAMSALLGSRPDGAARSPAHRLPGDVAGLHAGNAGHPSKPTTRVS